MYVDRWTKEKGLSCQFLSGSARDTVYSWAKTRLFTTNKQWCTVGMTQKQKPMNSKSSFFNHILHNIFSTKSKRIDEF